MTTTETLVLVLALLSGASLFIASSYAAWGQSFKAWRALVLGVVGLLLSSIAALGWM